MVMARARIAYSAVTQPLPVSFKNGGTFSSTEAVQMTQVSPARMSAEPSGSFSQSGVIVRGRSSSGRRPSGRVMGCGHYQLLPGAHVVGEARDPRRQGCGNSPLLRGLEQRRAFDRMIEKAHLDEHRRRGHARQNVV